MLSAPHTRTRISQQPVNRLHVAVQAPPSRYGNQPHTGAAQSSGQGLHQSSPASAPMQHTSSGPLLSASSSQSTPQLPQVTPIATHAGVRPFSNGFSSQMLVSLSLGGSLYAKVGLTNLMKTEHLDRVSLQDLLCSATKSCMPRQHETQRSHA